LNKLLYKIFSIGWKLFFIAIIIVTYIVYTNIKDLPDYNQLANYTPPVLTRLYAKDGKLLEEYAKERRLFIPIEAVPKQVKEAFISAEDKNFYQHPGVDVTSISRAAIQNIINYSRNKKSLVGGSTITQQVVKNFLLNNERSLQRKIKEAVLSFRISKVYSKDRILELYLNQIYLGAGSYGVASAALAYFDKGINDLALEEVALLASFPKAPTAFNPKKNYDRALERRNWVISRMYEDGYITKEDALEAIKKPIVLRKRSGTETVSANFFAEAVRQKIAEDFGQKALYEDGLFVRTTIDPVFQYHAEKAFRRGIVTYEMKRGYRGVYKHLDNLENWQQQLTNISREPALYDWQLAIVLKVLNDELNIGLVDGKEVSLMSSSMSWALRGRKPNNLFKTGDVILVETENVKNKTVYNLRQLPKINGGMVVMDPHTGKILAMVGGYSFDDSKFNRATQALRQPGSSFKPFVYLTAFEKGFAPTSIVNDGPIALSQGPGMPLWKPKNYHGDFLGPTTLRRGLELSRNTMTINLSQKVGIDPIIEMTKRLGIHDNPERVFSIVLGSVETTLLKMASAYSAIVNGGKKVNPIMIEKIQDRYGKTIYRSDDRRYVEIEDSGGLVPVLVDNKINIIDPRDAYQLLYVLQGVILHTKSSKPVRDLNRNIGGKTGTTNDSKDAWFIGFTPDLVIATYVGYDEPKTLGKKETGSTVAQPIFVDFVKNALKDVPDSNFKMPEGIEMKRVDYFTGVRTDSEYDSILEAFIVNIKKEQKYGDANQDNNTDEKNKYDRSEAILDGVY
jgi:penicillin-binding protein 1A